MQPTSVPRQRAPVQLDLVAVGVELAAVRAFHLRLGACFGGLERVVVDQALEVRLEELAAVPAFPIPAPARAFVVDAHDTARDRRQFVRVTLPSCTAVKEEAQT